MPVKNAASSKNRAIPAQTVKSNTDPRHLKRIKILKSLFAWQFTKNTDPLNQEIVDQIDKIDELISLSASKWPLEKINKVDLAILRLASWELLNKSQTPTKVIIDEAVELAKRYGSISSPGFVNGALGSLIIQIPQRHESNKS